MEKLLILALAWSLAMSASAASLKGSRTSMERQNAEATVSELSFIENDAQLESMVRNGYLVPLPTTVGLSIDPRLDAKWQYVRPWTARFLVHLGVDFHKEFGKSLQINSAVRTVERQEELREKNRNAAPPNGERRSVHPTGAAIDIAKLGRSGREVRWLARRLLQLERDGLIEATEERRNQAVFHVMVHKKYLPDDGRRQRPKKTARG